jgi:fucose 4-O-acetylase-like acetyltransferase
MAASGTHEGAGLAGIAAIVGMSVILAGRIDFGWGFLALALVAGCIFAAGMYWRRQRRSAGESTSVASASGGFLGAVTLLGVAVVLMACRYYWMQLFLGLAILAGAGLAVLMRWLQRRNSHIPIA